MNVVRAKNWIREEKHTGTRTLDSKGQLKQRVERQKNLD